MSLFPHWHSTVFGLWLRWDGSGGLPGTSSRCTRRTHKRRPAPGLSTWQSPADVRAGWSYLAFMQYLTIWIADLPAETSWYVPRTLTTWRVLAWFLIAFHLLVPFSALLSRRAKRSRTCLAWIAALLLGANLADALWLVIPGNGSGFALHWTDLLAPLGLGALWLWVFSGRASLQRMQASASLSRPNAAGPCSCLSGSHAHSVTNRQLSRWGAALGRSRRRGAGAGHYCGAVPSRAA